MIEHTEGGYVVISWAAGVKVTPAELALVTHTRVCADGIQQLVDRGCSIGYEQYTSGSRLFGSVVLERSLGNRIDWPTTAAQEMFLPALATFCYLVGYTFPGDACNMEGAGEAAWFTTKHGDWKMSMFIDLQDCDIPA